jgi:hypothetical protein
MLSASERADVESELSGLSAVGTLLLYAPVNDKELRKKFLPSSISGLESLGRQSSMQPIKPVIDLNLGIAYVNAAITKEQEGNVQQSMNYMKSAQSLFYSLGWEDYSEETLRAVARRDRDRWNGDLQVKARRK